MTTRTRLSTKPATVSTNWREYAACATTDPETFFPTGNKAQILAQTESAKRICGRCPVREWCLTWALESGQHTGVWGGLTEDERRDLARVRQPAMDLCLNKQEWIEEQLAAGRAQKQIARELGVEPGVVSRAIKRFRAEAGEGVAA